LGVEASDAGKGSSILFWLRRESLEDEFDWKLGRPVILLSAIPALNCLSLVVSSADGNGDMVSGSAIETAESVSRLSCDYLRKKGSECAG
jgi:hypothetical protein